MLSSSDRYKKIRVPRSSSKVSDGISEKSEESPERTRQKMLILFACIMGQITCGSLYLNMASFFPVYVDKKFNWQY